MTTTFYSRKACITWMKLFIWCILALSACTFAPTGQHSGEPLHRTYTLVLVTQFLCIKQVHGGQFSPIKRSSLTQFYHIFCQIGVIVKFAMQITFWGPNTVAANEVLSCLGILTWPSMKHGRVKIDPSFLIWSLVLKVSKSQMQFFLKLHCPKNEWNNIRQNSALWS